MANMSRRGSGSERTYRTARGYSDREEDNGRFGRDQNQRIGQRYSERGSGMGGRERYGQSEEGRRRYSQNEQRTGGQYSSYQDRDQGSQRYGGSYYDESPRRQSGRQQDEWGGGYYENPLSRYADDEQHNFERGGRRSSGSRYSDDSSYRSSGRAYSQMNEDDRSERRQSSGRQNNPQNWYADEDLWDEDDMDSPRYSGSQYYNYNEDELEDDDSGYRGSQRYSSRYR